MDSTICTGDLNDLVLLVRSKLGLDLSKYRTSTIRRRVSHRMSVLGIRELNEYMMHLTNTEDEIHNLLETVTVHVTEFFRDRDVFDTLFSDVFCGLLEKKRSLGHRFVRVWSAGCSTGEEAYSLAILLLQLIQYRRLDIRVEVFGTDISEESCRKARRGIYSEESIKDVPAKLRKRYFDMKGADYQVASGTKQYVKFRTHDLFNSSPFSMLDLVVCRNVLIHFNTSARDDVLSNFHSSLNDGGILVLGKSEALTGAHRQLFDLVDPRCKIYRKRTTQPL